MVLVACGGAREPSPVEPSRNAAVPEKRGAPLFTTDTPRYAFRGMHLDVARHFFGKDVVERYLDLLAFYKFNFFHWHLTDDQGFRLELKKHPELARVGGADGFYTQDDVREIVAYAKARGITVIPEIEMPGHARAILAAHPELSCTGVPQPVPRTWGVFDDVMCVGNEETLRLVEDVIDEVASLFPGPYLHVGGDEVPLKRWAACPKERALGLPTEAIEGWFMERVAKMVAARGKRAMVWDEAIDARLPKDVIVVAWQSIERGARATALGYDVVMAPQEYVYFNFHQARVKGEPAHPGFISWKQVLSFDPGEHVLGAEGALWTEYVTTKDEIDMMVAPRIAALADVLWRRQRGPGEEEDFARRFIAHRADLDALGVKYFVEPPDLDGPRHAFIDERKVAVAVPLIVGDGHIEPPIPRRLDRTTMIRAQTVLPNGRRSFVVESLYEKRRPLPGLELPAFAGVRYDYYEGAFKRLPDFSTLEPLRSDTTSRIGLLDSFRKEDFAVRYDTWVQAPATRVYRVVARSDDGIRVMIDDELVIDDDGEHEARDAEGEIALGAGFHRLRVDYFQGGGGEELSVRVDPLR